MSKRLIVRTLIVFLSWLSCQTAAHAQCSQNPLAVTCDDFESYTTGLISPQSAWWTPWSPPEDGILSAVVSTDYASQGTKSMKITYVMQGSTQGNDQILLLGGKTSGRYDLKWKALIPAGHAGYFNIQNSQTVGIKWNLDVYFDSTGTGKVIINPVGGGQNPNATFTFPKSQWFSVHFYFDLDNNIAKLFVDNNLVLGWAYPDNLGGIDFYALTQWDLVYLDELEYVALPAAAFNPDICNTAVDLTQFFGQPAVVPQTTGIFDNTHATTSASDPTPACWNEPAGTQTLNNTMWYTFTGDGEKYHIETVPCGATNYIGSSLPFINPDNPPGDTQMAIYSGPDCNSLAIEACNDDLNPNGEPDWRAGLDFQTVSGKGYYMMIDGFNYGNGLVSTGQYCIQVTKMPTITCDKGQVGTFTLDNGGNICNGSNISAILTLGSGYTIPDVGPVYGMSWAITTQPVPDGVWPPTMGGAFIDATIFVPQPFVFSSPNGYSQLIQRYITPVVVAGGTLYNPSNPANMQNVNPDHGCFFTGKSTAVNYLPPLTALVGHAVATPAGAQGNNGKITLNVSGGLADLTGDQSSYIFNWSNGQTTQNLDNLPPGTYTVTISDVSTCIGAIAVTAEVTTAAGEPESLRALVITPNPSAGITQLEVDLSTTADVQIEVINTLGQVLQSIPSVKTARLHQSLDLTGLANATYFVRVSIDGSPVLRRLVVQR